MVRWAAYVGASIAASAAVILRAFHERPNFYSATVYLGQSTACRMILLNMLLLTLASSIYGLQRLLYGPLRAIEVEQLWDKAWYAITETALAMTTFRDEVGGYFFLMFMVLLGGKVWGWIAEGRVETLEQQPPANPRTFHTRLIASLLMSELFDVVMLQYCARSILDQKSPRAGMMVMFVFEFAILAINSTSTIARYALALQERLTIQRQTKVKIEERKEEIRIVREEARRIEIEQATEGQTIPPPVPVSDDDVDENEIDVPGWSEKGVYILFVDLATDFLKLVFYMGFFMIIFFFAGIPIHMFRDLFLTTRSFLKRISDYLKYRNATRDMNSRYPDATPAELERDGTCIICREDMTPWEPPNVPHVNGGAAPRPNATPPDERKRPKKLPCGHILHVVCLRSWLERQQVCPTCRRSVLAPNTPATSSGATQNQPQGPAGNQQQPPGQVGGNNQGNQQPPAANQPGQPAQPGNGIRVRGFNLGGIRLTFATGNEQQFQNALQQARNPNGTDATNNNANTVIRNALEAVNAGRPGNVTVSNGSIQDQIQAMERQIMNEINQLGAAQYQLATVRTLQAELARLRLVQTNPAYTASNPGDPPPPTAVPQFRPMMQAQPFAFQSLPAPNVQPMQQQVLGSQPQDLALGPGHADLPEGMTLPEGWSMMPLHRLGPETQQQEHADGEADADLDEVVGQAAYQPSSSTASAGTSASAPENITGVTVTQSAPPVPPVPATAASASSFGTDPVPTTVVEAPTQTPAVNGHTTRSTSQQGDVADADPELFTGLPNWGNAAASSSFTPSTTATFAPSHGASSHEDPTANTLGQEAEESTATETQPNGANGEAHAENVHPMNGSARPDKGKGRAVTVEEEPDREA